MSMLIYITNTSLDGYVVALCGGLSLYFLTHVALHVRLVHFIRRTTTDRPGYIGPGRLAAGVAVLAVTPLLSWCRRSYPLRSLPRFVAP